MRPRDARTSLADAVRAGEAIQSFVAGRTFEEYRVELQLSSAVERQFEILGEALNRALRADPSLAERLPDAAQVVSFRNILAHGYDSVSDALVWSLALEKLPALMPEIRQLLA